MAQVKFVNAAKYKGIKYPAHTPFEVDDKDVESLVCQGAIVTVAPAATDDSGKSGKPLNEMKVAELKAYAKANNIDITGVERKDDILAAIVAAQESVNTNQ